MLQLPALDPEERAFLQSLQPNGALRALAGRVRQRLIAALGVRVEVRELPGLPARDVHSDEPVIEIENQLAGAWLTLRLGGKAGTTDLSIKDEALAEPLRRQIRLALAETVVNLGEPAWPPSLRMRVDIGPRQGRVEIFWNSRQAMTWARRAIRERA